MGNCGIYFGLCVLQNIKNSAPTHNFLVMIAFYMALKVSALLAVVILPLISPSKKKQIRIPAPALSSLVITENGYMHYLSSTSVKAQPVR
jgi:hypothetical protein